MSRTPPSGDADVQSFSDPDALLAHVRDDLASHKGNYCLLLVGGRPADKLSLAEALARELRLPFVKVDTPDLLGDRASQTRGNLREAFDTASSAKVLYLEALEALVQQEDADPELHEEVEEEIYYLCQRVESHHGVTIFSVDERRNVAERLCRDVVDLAARVG